MLLHLLLFFLLEFLFWLEIFFVKKDIHTYIKQAYKAERKNIIFYEVNRTHRVKYAEYNIKTYICMRGKKGRKKKRVCRTRDRRIQYGNMIPQIVKFYLLFLILLVLERKNKKRESGRKINTEERTLLLFLVTDWLTDKTETMCWVLWWW